MGEIKLEPRTYWSPLEVKSSDEPPQAFQVEVPPPSGPPVQTVQEKRLAVS